MSRWWVVACVIALSCKGKEKQADKPPEPKPTAVDATAPAVDAGSADMATPKSKRGFIVYSVANVAEGKPIENDALALFDPDSDKPIATTIAKPDDIVVGQHVIAGRGDKDFFVLDLRAPTLVAKKSEHPVEHITPDDKLVTRCEGGMDRPFKICVSDGDPAAWKPLHEEPKKGDNDVGVVTAAGRDIVHGNYTQLSKLPAFSIRISDKKRTEYPGLIRKTKDYTIEPSYSPSGAKAASCAKDLLVTTLDGSAKPQSIKLDSEPVRCTCRFSSDDTKLACSILYEAKEDGVESLWLWDLKSNAKTMVAKRLGIGSFVWSPDSTQIAYVGDAENPNRWVLRTTSLDGKTVKDLISIEMKPHLVDLAGWTAP